MEDNEVRLGKLEAAVVALAAAVGESIPQVEEIQKRMLDDWTEMQDGLMARDNISRDDADDLLDDMFGKIERGELKPDGSPLDS